MLTSNFKILPRSKKVHNGDQGFNKWLWGRFDREWPMGTLTGLGPFIPGNKS